MWSFLFVGFKIGVPFTARQTLHPTLFLSSKRPFKQDSPNFNFSSSYHLFNLAFPLFGIEIEEGDDITDINAELELVFDELMSEQQELRIKILEEELEFESTFKDKEVRELDDEDV